MKCVILVAGLGERMMPLTAKTPKPLLKVNGKALIDYVLESLPNEITEIIIVVYYLSEKIMKHVGNEYKGRKVTYVRGSIMGNAFSFMSTRPYLDNERFLLIYGDEIPRPKNVKRCLDEELSILTFNFGIKDGVMVLNTDIFNYPPLDNVDFRTMVDKFCRTHHVVLIEAEDFVGEINTIKDLERVRKCLK